MEWRCSDLIVERHRRRVGEGRSGESAEEENDERVREAEVAEEVVVLRRVRAVNSRVVKERFDFVVSQFALL